MTYVTDRRAILTNFSLAGSTSSGQPIVNHPLFLTYSFEENVSAVANSVGNFTPAFADSFQPLNNAQRTAARDAFRQWADASGLVFFEVPSGSGDVKLAMFDFDKGGPYSSGRAAAYATGDGIFVSNKAFNNATIQLFLHEIGHDLGFKHSFEGDFTLAPADDNYAHTVMSYTSGGTDGSSLGTIDREAITYLYGASDQDGKQVASWSWNASTYTLTQTGFETADVIRGTAADDVIDGRDGDDYIDAKNGNNIVSGGVGDDRIVAGKGEDSLYGGAGKDLINGGDGKDIIYGGEGDDSLTAGYGGLDANTLYGGADNDTLSGGAGNDLLDGGDGNDNLYGGGGNDTFYGGAGNDSLSLTIGIGVPTGVIDGGTGSDTLNVYFADAAPHQLATSQLAAAVEYISLAGNSGADILTIDSAVGGSLTGNAGDDILRGGNGQVSLYGGDGADRLIAGTGFNFLYGGAGADRFVFETAASSTSAMTDQIEDFQTGLDRIDLLDFSPTNVTISGGYINAQSVTGAFRLYVRQAVALSDIDWRLTVGTNGDDTLIGTASVDTLRGLAANDVLIGGASGDVLTGGAGADTFLGSRADLNGDQITDLTVGDRITVTDVAVSTLGYTRSGSTLGLGAGVSLDIGAGNVRLVYRANGAGTDLIAVNRWAGLSDYTGDGHSDLIFRNVNGSISTWAVSGDGRQVQQSAFNGSTDTSWKIVETFDWNGDARSDILFRNDNGAVAIWNASGAGFDQSSYYHAPVSTAWRIAGTGDIDGDGRDDLLWQHADGAISAWASTGAGFQENSYFHASPGGGWKVAGLEDFNGDGKADILWRNTDGGVATWLATGTGGFVDGGYFTGGVPTSWHIVGTGDFNGDGRGDIVWRNDNGALSIWRSNGAGFDQGAYDTRVSTDWRVAQVGDLNGDGRADLVWRNDNGAVSTWQSNGAGFDQSVYNSSAATSWTIAAHQALF